jgi:hypothetical protein
VFAGVTISPLEDFEKTVAQFKEESNRDGFFYPSPQHTVTLPDWPDESRREPVPRTERPAHLFFMKSSHSLKIDNSAAADPVDDASFLVQAIAYLYGTRLQLEGFQFDGRIPSEQSTHPVHVTATAAHRFLGRAYSEWKAQPADRRLKFTNVLYMHAKAPSYDWTWEQFLIEYLVNDALFDISQRTGLTSPVSHEDRIRELCARLGVWCPPTAPVTELVAMRNELFHEAMWEGERPGYRIKEQTYRLAGDLRALNQRLISALLSGRSIYTQNPWTNRQVVSFF